MDDLRSYVKSLGRGQLRRVKPPASPRYEIAAATAAADGGPALLFENVGKFRVVANLVGTRARFALAAGSADVYARLSRAVASARDPRAAPSAPFESNSSRSASALPVVRHFSKEPGPFITTSIIYAKNPQTGAQNLSFHRMMPLDGRHFTVRMVEGRHLDRCFEHARDRGEDLRVAVTVGVHPAVSIAGAYQHRWGLGELGIANRLLGGRLRVRRLPYSGLSVPDGSEIVMEGRILKDRREREWMVEMLRTYDRPRRQPVFELERMYWRERPIYHDVLSGYSEHRLLMGMPAESKLNIELKKRHPQVRRAVLTGGGSRWMHAVVQVGSGRGAKSVIRSAFAIHRSLKQAVVVDADIDPEDPSSVEYAVATRFQADRDLVVLRGVRGSSLDPSSDQKKLLTAKMGMDATVPPGRRPEGFEVARIPRARARP